VPNAWRQARDEKVIRVAREDGYTYIAALDFGLPLCDLQIYGTRRNEKETPLLL
jgi:hypothetical protein